MTFDIETEIKKQRDKINYYTVEYPLEEAIKYFQVHDCKTTWDDKQQSKFIESLLLGLPVFSIKVIRNQEQFTIIDGKQRLIALTDFVENRLILSGLNILKQLNDYRFGDLVLSRQRKFKRITCRVIEIVPKSDLSFWVDN